MHLQSTFLIALFLTATYLPAQTSRQFEAQRQQRYLYSTFSAMSAPVVLPMDGKTDSADWLTGLDVSLADKIFPHVHMDTAFGTATRDQAELAVGHHDPVRRDGVTFQNIEFSLSGRLDDHNEFFITHAANVGEDDQWNGVWEEFFWKLKDLPGGFELRGGRVYNRFGIQNTYHPHGFDWIDQYLVNARMLGDDSMTTLGAEITWLAPLPWTSQFDVALGVAPAHDDEEEPFTGLYNAEEASFNDEDLLTVANWTNVYNYNDFHQYRGGVSGAWGHNHAGFRTHIYGTHLEYQWRENGFDTGGSYFRVRSEVMFRRFQVEDEVTGLRGNRVGEAGAYVSVLYGLPSRFEFGLRGDFVSGDTETERDARFRLSPGITWYANAARTLRFRVQYNYDHSSQFGDDHGIWAQVSLAWGGPEVR